MAPIQRRITFFDLDDTAYDRTPLRPECLLHCAPDSRIEALLGCENLEESVNTIRKGGEVFEGLGLPYLRHRTDSPTLLAALLVLYGQPSQFKAEWGITTGSQQTMLRALTDASRALNPPVSPTWQESLVRALAFRRLLLSRNELAELRDIVRRLSVDPEVLEMAQSLRGDNLWSLYEEFIKVWAQLEEGGAKCYIVSEGDEETQRGKLVRLGLGPEYSGALITSGRTSRPLDATAFRHYSDELLIQTAREISGLDRFTAGTAFSDPAGIAKLIPRLPEEVVHTYIFRWILDAYAWKAPPFYARVINAVVSRPDAALEALDDFDVPPACTWLKQDVRLAMIGNDQTKDVAPLQELLGPGVAWTGWLKLGREGIKPTQPGRDPTRSFDSWMELQHFLLYGFSWKTIPPIRKPPILANCEAFSPYILGSGVESRFAVVRRLSQILLVEASENQESSAVVPLKKLDK